MDTEKYVKLQHKILEGESPTDEGPFYHHSWWESYKGSIKGKLGGIIIGALMGAIVGGAAVGVLWIGGVTAIPAGIAFAALTGAGILYGAHEFSEIGKVVGAQSAGLEQMDARDAIRFGVIEKKLDTLTKLLKNKSTAGDRAAADVSTNGVEEELDNYRTTHYAQLKPDAKNRYVFGKIALIGLAVGAAAGAILAVGGEFSAAAHILEAFGLHGLPEAAITTISTVTFGLFGASFGINRDIFRRVFDVTDLWSKGIFRHGKVRQQQIEAGKGIMEENGSEVKDIAAKSKVATAILPEGYEGQPDYPTSNTFHRDRVLAAAEKALLSFDHTRATPQ